MQNVIHLIASLDTGGAEKLLVDVIENTNYLENCYLCVVNNVYLQEYKNRVLNKLGKRACFLDRIESSRNIGFLFKLIKFIDSNNIRIIHVHNEFSKRLAIVIKTVRPKMKIVFTVHDTKIVTRYGPIYKLINKLYISKFITISKAVTNETEQVLKKQDGSISLIYNGINTNFYRLGRSRNKEDKILICCLSRYIIDKKGQDILIEAINALVNKYRIRNFRCDFYGKIYHEIGRLKDQFNVLNNMVKENRLNEYISLNDKVTEIPELLSKYDILVLPSRNEGLGLVILEGMASGLVVVASELEGPKEIIEEDGEYGFMFPPGDSNALAEKLAYILNNLNSKKVAEIKERADKRVNDLFDIKVMVAKYEGIYAQL